MCGRFLRISLLSLIAELFDVTDIDTELVPSYNIAPTQDVAAIVQEDGKRRLVQFRWGLIPFWAKDRAFGSRTINARAETVADKPSFRAAFRKRRCLVVADGFYEWRKDNGTKTPVFISLKSRQPFGFAGLHEQWTSPEGESVRSCTIITTGPNDLVRPIHNRMPVILPVDKIATWLDPTIDDRDVLLPLLKPYDADQMTAHDVSRRVNAPINDGPDLIHPV